MLEEVSGCSAGLVHSMVGGATPPNLSVSGVAPSSVSIPVPSKADDGDAAFTQALVTIIYEYLSVGKPQAITNWLAALQASILPYFNLMNIQPIFVIHAGLSPWL